MTADGQNGAARRELRDSAVMLRHDPVTIEVIRELDFIKSLLKFPEHYADVHELVSPDHLMGGTPMRVLRAMRNCHARGIIPALAEVCSDLLANGHLQSISHDGYVAERALEIMREEGQRIAFPVVASRIHGQWVEREEQKVRALAALRLKNGESLRDIANDLIAVDERTTFRNEKQEDGPYAVEGFPFKLWAPEEIWAPVSEPDWLIEGLMVRRSLTMICAHGSSLKTWAAADLALSAAMGLPWLERFECAKTSSAIIDWESGSDELRRRYHMIARGREIPIPIANSTFCTMSSLSFGSPKFADYIRALTKKYKLIIFDSLSAGSRGIDENDARIAEGLNDLKLITEETGACFLVLHHSRKAKADGSGDERENPRGSGAIFNSCDIVLQLSRAEGEAFTVRQTKSRGGKKIAPFILRVDDLEEGVSGIVRGVDEQEKEERGVTSALKTIDRAKSAILQILTKDRDIRSGNELHSRIKLAIGKAAPGRTVTLEALKELQSKERNLVSLVNGRLRLSSEVES